jgi:hypothetical protein
MKLIQNIAALLGCCLMAASYAENGPLTFSGTFPYSREPSLSNNTYWGTSLTEGSYGRQLVNFIPGVSGESAISYPESFIPNLRPKGSDVAFGVDGYVEKQWPLSEGSVLYTTQIGGYNYLFKLKYHPATDTYSVGNNPPAFDNKQAVMNMGERNGSGPQADIRVLHQRSVLVATIDKGTATEHTELFYGEYNISKAQPWVALWKSTNMGDTWSKVIEWNTVGHQTRHIHGVVQNPYNGWVYILLGDADSEAGIVAWDGKSAPPPDNTPISQMGNYPGWKSISGSQRVRGGDLIFTPPPPDGNGKCIWIPDVDVLNAGEILYGQRANYDLTGLEATSPVPFINGIPAIIGARSPNGNIYWSSFRISTAAERKLHIWKSTDSGLNWALAAKADVYTDWTSVPQNLYVRYSAATASSGTDYLYLTGRDLEFVNGGAKRGSTVVFNNPIDNAQPLPVTSPDMLTMLPGQTKEVRITDNDTNVAGSTVLIVTPAGNGVMNATSPGVYAYTPNPGFAGEDSFTYALQNTAGTSNVSKVTIYVNAAQNDSYSAIANSSRTQTISVSATNGVGKNDLPAGVVGRTFAVVNGIRRISGTGNALITLSFNNNDGSFSYTLTAPSSANSSSKRRNSKLGTYQFSYSMTLNGVTTPSATATITVN